MRLRAVASIALILGALSIAQRAFAESDWNAPSCDHFAGMDGEIFCESSKDILEGTQFRIVMSDVRGAEIAIYLSVGGRLAPDSFVRDSTIVASIDGEDFPLRVAIADSDFFGLVPGHGPQGITNPDLFQLLRNGKQLTIEESRGRRLRISIDGLGGALSATVRAARKLGLELSWREEGSAPKVLDTIASNSTSSATKYSDACLAVQPLSVEVSEIDSVAYQTWQFVNLCGAKIYGLTCYHDASADEYRCVGTTTGPGIVGYAKIVSGSTVHRMVCDPSDAPCVYRAKSIESCVTEACINARQEGNLQDNRSNDEQSSQGSGLQVSQDQDEQEKQTDDEQSGLGSDEEEIGALGSVPTFDRRATMAPPVTTSGHIYVVNYNADSVLYEKAGDEKFQPGSMSKLMTVYLLFEALKHGDVKLTDSFHVSKRAWSTRGSKMFVTTDSDVLVEDLIRGIIVQSGNDACVVVAEGLAGSEEAFADRMNKRAAELGLNDSHFVNASGLPDPNQLMTARDLYLLGKHLFEDFPEDYHYFREKEFAYHGIKQGNRNPLLYRPNAGVDGLKASYSEEAGFGMVVSAIRDGRRVFIVVAGLGSMQDHTDEAGQLLDWAYLAFSD